MSVTITLNDALANQLRSQASVEERSVEDFAVQLLSEAVEQRLKSSSSAEQNQRRVELIRKSNREGLSADETEQLRQLQAALDERLEHWDNQLLGELSRMEHAVQTLSDNGS